MSWRSGAAADALSLRSAPRLLILAGLAICALAAVHWWVDSEPMAMAAAISRHPVVPLSFLAVHIAASLVFVPRTVLAIGAGLIFGTGWGIFWAELGSVAGAVAGFLLSRYLSSGFVDVRRTIVVKPALDRIGDGGWRAVALLRLVPIMPHSLSNYALGLTRVRLGPYAFGSMLGQLPLTIAYVELGAAGEGLLLDRAGWIKPTLIGLAVLLLSLLLPAYFRWRSRWTAMLWASGRRWPSRGAQRYVRPAPDKNSKAA
jgi:uncharacterized membrane protein YdjX (TVP38/TMEM64 family)